MNDIPENLRQTNCAFVGEGVTFKGSITASEKLVVFGTVEGHVEARDLFIIPTGIIKGNVRVDQADIQGTVLENIEAKVCLSLRKTGRVEGNATYGEIEIEKGGLLLGHITTPKSEQKAQDAAGAAPIPFGGTRPGAIPDDKKVIRF